MKRSCCWVWLVVAMTVCGGPGLVRTEAQTLDQPTYVLDFSTGNARVEMTMVPPGFSGLTDVTLSAWIQRTAVPAAIEAIAGQGYLDSNRGFGLYLNTSGNIAFQVRDNVGGGTTASAAAAFPFGPTWHHVAGVRAGNDTILYLDGEEVARLTRALGAITPTVATEFGLGARHTFSAWGYYYAGKMAEVRLWDHARSAAQIRALMKQRLVGNESGLLGYWPLDEGAGSTAGDESSNSNDGAITNPAWVQQVICPPTGTTIMLR